MGHPSEKQSGDLKPNALEAKPTGQRKSVSIRNKNPKANEPEIFI